MLRRWRGDTALLLKSPAVTRDELLAEPGDLGPLRAALEASGAPRVFMVNRFAVDDAWREVFAAARLMPGARFFVTGDPAKAGLSPGDAPGNVVLTGFLSKPVFAALMDACDVTLSLTLRRDTLLWSIRESVALGKPFVTSDSPVIRAEFEGLGLFTDHSAESLRDRILEAVENRDLWAEAMAGYITRDRARWAGQIAEIRGRMG
jgi:glycosyltransferase involved in cell wall biosynthesis